MKKTDGRGDPLPIGGVSPRFRVVTPKPGHPLHLLILNPTWDGMDTHWLPASEDRPGRTIICELPDPCPCQQSNLPYKWHGYIGCINAARGDTCILSMTKLSLNALLMATPDLDSLRGHMVIARRQTDHASSTVIFDPAQRKWQQPIPLPFRLDASLATVYGAAAVERWRERSGGKDGGQ